MQPPRMKHVAMARNRPQQGLRGVMIEARVPLEAAAVVDERIDGGRDEECAEELRHTLIVREALAKAVGEERGKEAAKGVPREQEPRFCGAAAAA